MFQFYKLEILMIAELNNLVKLIYGCENPLCWKLTRKWLVGNYDMRLCLPDIGFYTHNWTPFHNLQKQ